MKKLILLTLFISTLFADNYYIKYKGFTLGKIESLDTLNQSYLKAKVTNSIVHMMLGHDFYVFYDGIKPNIEDAKFRSDNKKILFALNEAIKSKPKHNDYIIDKDRNIILSCQSDKVCEFNYYSYKEHRAQGIITFDENGKFQKLVEKKSTLVIEKE